MQQAIIFHTQETPMKAVKGDPVYEAFKKEAFALIGRGWKHYAAKTIIEVIRHHSNVAHGPHMSDGYKINNNATAFYARKFMQDFPEHDGFFKTRRSQYDDIV